MSSDFTQKQSPEEQQRAVELSLKRTRPPAEIPGYQARRFLGAGAYGEVWVAVDENTGRQVAIKYYLHRGGVDWSLLSREVEKLVMLSADRYVVQLLDVGWDADPPYYVMEFIEQGSLDDHLRGTGSLAPDAAVEIFREVATGLAHSHAKGILHCDLKPANVLLDQDHKPRLADFGQSRLSHDQTPALGTLFYMAPEQADLEAIPDARWDVYALGALLYSMLCGSPPHRNETAVTNIDSATDLPDRLARYRRLILSSPRPAGHRHVPGVDSALVEIIDRCLCVEPDDRFQSVQGVLDALRVREEARARRPLIVLGFVGPCLLLAIMGLFGWHGYHQAMRESDQLVTQRTAESSRFAAKFAAESAAREIGNYFRAVEELAQDEEFLNDVTSVVEHAELKGALEKLGRADLRAEEFELLAQRIQTHPARQGLDKRVRDLMGNSRLPSAASWFITDARGTHLAAVFEKAPDKNPVGRNFAYRTYFHGGNIDLQGTWRADDGQHIQETHLSAVFQSTATNTWKVAVSTPLWSRTPARPFLGILAVTVEIGRFVQFEGTPEQFAVLVDTRPGDNQGVILQHPLFSEQRRISRFRVDFKSIETTNASGRYRDPVSEDPAGEAYRREWIASSAPVALPRIEEGETKVEDTGLVILVQQDYEAATRPIHQLGVRLASEGLLALGVVIVVVLSLWYFVIKVVVGRRTPARSGIVAPSAPTPVQAETTLPGRGKV